VAIVESSDIAAKYFGTLTAAETSLLDDVIAQAHASVRKHIGYNPETLRRTEYYPRHDLTGGISATAVWDVNAARTHARLEAVSATALDSLQLERLPVRTIHTVKVDSNGNFGNTSGAFGSGTSWTEGDDFWGIDEQSGLNKSGILLSNGTWTVTPGSIEVDYTAGYTAGEFAGTDTDVDALPIQRAVIGTSVKAFNMWQSWKKKSIGWVPGAFKSEKLGDYSYTRDTSAGSTAMLNMEVSIPTEFLEDLEPYVHYGVHRL